MKGRGGKLAIWRELAACVYGGGSVVTMESLRREGAKLRGPRGCVEVRLQSEDVRMPCVAWGGRLSLPLFASMLAGGREVTESVDGRQNVARPGRIKALVSRSGPGSSGEGAGAGVAVESACTQGVVQTSRV